MPATPRPCAEWENAMLRVLVRKYAAGGSCLERALAEALRLGFAAGALTSSGERPEALPLTDPDTPAFPRAGVSVPQGRPVETSSHGGDDARGRQPEQPHV
ncbi:hypothetical protein BH10PSE14_BH10PSE14_04710 [soil metagenome]